MRCSICRRPLLHPAVPGLQIGPKCARDRGLMPAAERRRAVIVAPVRRRKPTSAQVDWVDALAAFECPTQSQEGSLAPSATKRL